MEKKKNLDNLSLEGIEKLSKDGVRFIIEDGHIYKEEEEEA